MIAALRIEDNKLKITDDNLDNIVSDLRDLVTHLTSIADEIEDVVIPTLEDDPSETTGVELAQTILDGLDLNQHQSGVAA